MQRLGSCRPAGGGLSRETAAGSCPLSCPAGPSSRYPLCPLARLGPGPWAVSPGLLPRPWARLTHPQGRDRNPEPSQRAQTQPQTRRSQKGISAFRHGCFQGLTAHPWPWACVPLWCWSPNHAPSSFTSATPAQTVGCFTDATGVPRIQLTDLDWVTWCLSLNHLLWQRGVRCSDGAGLGHTPSANARTRACP